LIALLCATPMEFAGIISLLHDVIDKKCPGGMRLVTGKSGSSDVLVLAAGIGKVSSASGTRFVMDNYNLDSLLICGTAGALSPQVRVGDLVISTELIPGDVGIARTEGLSPTGPGILEEGKLVFCPSFAASTAMIERARTAADTASLSYQQGGILTCDQIIFDTELRSHLGDSFGALAVEMEGAAAAQVASEDGLPFVAVRGISDDLSHDFPGLEALLHYRGQTRYNLWRKRFKLSVTDPNTLAGAKELARGGKLAMRNVVSFLEAFLGNE
jgi:adenosylhomocysteine nucleosidase